MKRLLGLLVICSIFILLFTGCGSENDYSDLTPAVAAGIPPTAWIVKQIAGNRMNVISLLSEGRNPHSYNPEPKEIAALAKAKVFFSVQTNFEKTVAASLKRNLTVVDLVRDLNLRTIENHEHEHENCANDATKHHHHKDGFDPHVWFDMSNLKLMAAKIAAELKRINPVESRYFEMNLSIFNSKVDELERKTHVKLDKYAGEKFMVYHPAFGYFANTFKLEQVVIENDGREVNAGQIMNLILKSKKISCKIIFVQKGFNAASAHVIAKQLGVRLVEIDPLKGNVFENITFLADNIVAGLR